MGQIGSELVPELSKSFGRDSITATSHNKSPEGEILSFASFETIDVRNKEAISAIVRKKDVDTIYHLAGILSAAGESNPVLAYEVNMQGLHNVLEVAKEEQVSRVFWPSSIAVFGSNAPRKNTPQDTSLIPSTIYGVAKAAGELLCNYYHSKYGLDVRSLRYPGIISSETLPGGGTTDYAVEIFYEAIKNHRYVSFVEKDTVLPMLYMPDCIKATLDLMNADKSKISIHTSYNLGGLSFSVGDLVEEIRKYIPQLVVEYKPDFRQQIADSWPMSIDDSVAKNDWAWEPTYNLPAMTQDMITRLSTRLEQN